jgi:putative endonuclease
MSIYILEFQTPLGNEKHQARYYLGYCDNLERRLKEHEQGKGAAITRACVERGISFKVVAYFPGDRTLERRLKNQKNTARIVANYRRGVIPC